MTGTFAAATRPQTPVHLWIVGILALLWNAMGAFDFLATTIPLESYMSQFTQEQLDYFYGMPLWMMVVWAASVWGGVLAAVGLLVRKAWSVWLFGLSMLTAVIATLYCFILSDGAEIMGTTGAVFSAVILLVAIFFFFYARAMAKRGVLV